ncbi:MAG: DinB family protein [Acidimicrobiia bacterium]
MRVWLLEGLPDAEPGFQAWALDFLGLATWASTSAVVLERMPVKYNEYRAWMKTHRLADPGPETAVEVVDAIKGDEVLFTPDREPSTVGELDLAVQLLEASRRDLLATLQGLPAKVLDWDPSYKRFLPWARWRTIRQVVAHLANTETHYYLAAVGFRPPSAPMSMESDWQAVLAHRRAEALAFLDGLREASDLARIDDAAGWSVRKVLRRLIWHERLHTKSIRRIVAEYSYRQR